MEFKLVIDPAAKEEVTATLHKRTPLADELEELVLAYGEQITALSDDEMIRLSWGDIECLTVENDKTYVITQDGARYRIRQRLYEAEARLPAYFIRINKSSIANRRRIAKFTIAFNGAVDAVFKSGFKEYVSRRCFAEIKRRLNET